jgi:hypothetical protein
MQRQDREHDQQLITYITWALMRSLSQYSNRLYCWCSLCAI